jgi:dTDP-glucose pyrophosphorylase
MINVVLMAGFGKRFSDAKYKISKPLLPVSDKPMIVRAVESMPKNDKWIFVVRDEHLKEKKVINILKSIAPDVRIMVNPNSTSQLSSALIPKEYYNDEPLFIGACDIGMIYNQEEFRKLIKSGKADVISFSFTKQFNLSKNPQAYGWLKQDKDMRVNGISVKVPISDDPFNDYAITGAFVFKSGKYFIELADEIIKRNIKVNNEYYVDSTIGIACERGDKVVSFPVKLICWGTPAEYEENKNYFKQ